MTLVRRSPPSTEIMSARQASATRDDRRPPLLFELRRGAGSRSVTNRQPVDA